ncbi:MAG: hypothetical protein LQ342_005215 [Letrouitia transgressa]|nr:MAG: hypothetical protein LQ342_005215 [Letrouitia transgressa]
MVSIVCIAAVLVPIGTLLGLIQVAIIPIPVVFYKYGHKIRMKSILIRRLQEDKARWEGKRASRNVEPRPSKVNEEGGMEKAYSNTV